MIKTKLRNILLAATATLAFAACDEVSEGDRFIHMDKIEPQRSVLLVDFTGQGCLNCPAAHDILASLQQEYGDSLVAVSMHVPKGSLGLHVKRTKFPDRVGLAYDEGLEYDKRYNTLGSLPAGVIDMHTPALGADAWSAAVRQAFIYGPKAVVKLEPRVEGDSVKVTSHVSCAKSQTANLTIWLLEDGIVARQQRGNEVIQDYVHNHVFRRAVNGIDGTELTLQAGQPVTMSFAVELVDSDKEHFNRDNLHVIGFVQDGSGVLEATNAKVENLTAN